jgi:hypothetical protein
MIRKKHRGIKFRAVFFCHFVNFELIAVSVIKSSVSPAAYPLLCRKSLFFNVNGALITKIPFIFLYHVRFFHN